jgi:hypothetical protein
MASPVNPSLSSPHVEHLPRSGERGYEIRHSPMSDIRQNAGLPNESPRPSGRWKPLQLGGCGGLVHLKNPNELRIPGLAHAG